MRDRAHAFLRFTLLWALTQLYVSGARAQADARDTSDWLQFHGQERLLYAHTSVPELGLMDERRASVDLVLLRNLFGLSLRAAPRLRAEAQLGVHLAFGGVGTPQPPDADFADVHLLFLEWTPEAKRLGLDVRLRVGRQELVFGSTRWFSARDGTNVRLAFDLARLTLATSRVNADGFAGVLPRLARGWLDDAPDLDHRLFGGYVTVQLLPEKQLALDIFAVARYRPQTHYQEHAGRELRRTLGVRLFGETAFGLAYVLHGLVQWGQLEDARIRAWGAAAGLWQRLFPAPYELRLGLRADALSGDGRRNDRVIGTFQPLFPNQSFFSTQPAIYPANVYDLHPLLKFASAGFELELGCALFWRQRTSDAVYGAAGQPLFSGAQTRERFSGAQLSGELAYRATEQLGFMLAYAQLVMGPALRAAGGEHARLFATSVTFTY